MSDYTIADLTEKCNVDDNGVYRWKTSNNVVPGDILEKAGFTDEGLAANKVARDIQITESLTAYVESQKNRSPEQIAEAQFGARAAHGPGVEIVNFLTGEKWTT